MKDKSWEIGTIKRKWTYGLRLQLPYVELHFKHWTEIVASERLDSIFQRLIMLILNEKVTLLAGMQRML